jgi:serine protease
MLWVRIAAILIAAVFGFTASAMGQDDTRFPSDTTIIPPTVRLVMPHIQKVQRARSQWPVASQPRYHPLSEAPPPQYYVAPGIEGVLAQLRAADARTNEGAKVPALSAYKPYASPSTPTDTAHFLLGQIVVKFAEGSAVRLRNGGLVADKKVTETSSRLARFGLELADVDRDLVVLNKVMSVAGAVVGRSTLVEEADLDSIRRRAEAATAAEQPDLNLFYFIHLDKPQAERAQALLTDVRRLRIVEAAYFQPIPFDASDIPPQTTINVTGSQNYFRPSPSGIDVDYARLLQGGRGNSVRVADVEAGWREGHEDLPVLGFRIGVDWGSDHGAAVLGQIAAEDNSFGATGIAPDAVIGWSSVSNLNPLQPIYFYSVGNALMMATNVLQPGDVALIEQQFLMQEGFACSSTTDPCGDCSLTPWVAVEEYPNEHAAISALSGIGIIVVEAAGNGRTVVMPASSRDSGAIVVGASNTSLAPMCWSNTGSRVNVHGWGTSIGTIGYGGVASPNGASPPIPAQRANGNDPQQWYTTTFGGTSGASPIVAGAVALVQSTRMAIGLPRLTPLEMRDLLVATGTPQAAPVTRNIGPLPNLRAAIATYRPDSARFVRQSPSPTGTVLPGATFQMSETFQNNGGTFWTGSHSLSIAPSYQSGVQQFTGPTFSLGTAATPIGPNEEVTPQFAVGAPGQPGTYSLAFKLKNNSGQSLATSQSLTIVVAALNASIDNADASVSSAPGSLPNGATGAVSITATNTGNTTWTPGSYSLRLNRFNRISIPNSSVPLTTSVGPRGVVTFAFTIICNGRGTGWFSGQMVGGSGGFFGQTASQTVVCQ